LTKTVHQQRHNPQSAAVLRSHHAAVVKSLISGIKVPRKRQVDGESESIFEQRTADSLDLLIGHFQGKRGYGALYAGKQMFEIFRQELTREENLSLCRTAVGEDQESLRSFLAPFLGKDELEAFDESYRSATFGLVNEAKRHIRTLFLGDCLQIEIASFLLGPLMAKGISIDPYPISARNLPQLKQDLEALSVRDFDVIFYSPFSHAALPEVGALVDKAFMSTADVETATASILEQTKTILDYLCNRFECPIYVHNAALVPRSPSSAKAAIFSLTTKRQTDYARSRINRWLADYVSLYNSANFQHVFIINEDAIAERVGRREAGRYLHASSFQHPTVLSEQLASEYLSRITVVANLLGKKLVICDLDNTLWDGLIGEGKVSQFTDRQHVLKKLKDHGGVVLSIASKNEPTLVHFTDCLLSEKDFVAPQISWDLKTHAIEKIKSSLNLQTKHMIFLDDRADERLLVQDAFPSLLVLNPCDPDVWTHMDLWAELIFGSSDLDRTRMYQEQAVREAETSSTAADSVEALKKLGLVITLRAAERKDLKRATELINRTNQWNLCGSRTTFEQMRTWHSSNNAHILLASASDRFGDMGIVCAAIVTVDEDRAEIPIFVLSCRVFGYGVETAMLSEIARRCGIGTERKTLFGPYIASIENHPCRNMYTDHGFQSTDGGFLWGGAPTLPGVPWADVHND
jgi:FkbH-like protein